MATKKPKASAKVTKPKTTKPKTAAKTVEEPVSEAPKVTTTPKDSSSTCLKGFFGKKYDGEESILTIFKKPRFYGALLGEVIGTLLVTLMLFSLSLLGIYNASGYAFAIIAVFIAVYAFSGACLNPIVTVGMMASRRMSVIRGVMYIIAEIVGAWLAWVIFNAFHAAGGDAAIADLPALTEIADGQFATFAFIELLGAIVIAFFFARALKYKRSVFTFGAVVAGGITLAILLGYVISAAFFFSGMANNFIFNPASALMYQIFPTAGEDFGVIMGGIGQALAVYALFPMIGGVLGFYLSDFTARLSGETE